jgi:hypothetical protein
MWLDHARSEEVAIGAGGKSEVVGEAVDIEEVIEEHGY